MSADHAGTRVSLEHQVESFCLVTASVRAGIDVRVAVEPRVRATREVAGEPRVAAAGGP
jgi:hypothetical protein